MVTKKLKSTQKHQNREKSNFQRDLKKCILMVSHKTDSPKFNVKINGNFT